MSSPLILRRLSPTGGPSSRLISAFWNLGHQGPLRWRVYLAQHLGSALTTMLTNVLIASDRVLEKGRNYFNYFTLGNVGTRDIGQELFLNSLQNCHGQLGYGQRPSSWVNTSDRAFPLKPSTSACPSMICKCNCVNPDAYPRS